MTRMVDIDVILDEKYTDPKVTIYAKNRNAQVDSIIEAVEKASENEFPMIPASDGRNTELLSQRDIIRVYTQGRKIMIRTAEGEYSANRTLSAIEDMLNPDRFLRISQSEIINLNKVKRFDINIVGTIGIEFDNGGKSWASRSRVKAIKALLNE